MANTRRHTRALAALALTAGLLTTGAIAAADIIATPQGDTAWGAPAGEDHDPTTATDTTTDTGTTVTPLDTAWG
ncbi:hypothetical protein ACGFZS_46985 [Streptomyces sp. NPDC048288]|uniref:hypothetical protein n=1 Tax=Streptomyces sp. NPDC048288 TaxID=3365529 RepID=UPI00371BC623